MLQVLCDIVMRVSGMRPGHLPSDRRRWALKVAADGRLQASLTGGEPSVEVIGEDLASLVRQVARLRVAARREAGSEREQPEREESASREVGLGGDFQSGKSPR